ncbi:hypothetical protein B4N89_00825 [Embleya scabrispora]|uniref:DUF892 family protein n=1 Tax=Embleya scabrispora TaxID=159449 RepID=A0A1T3NST2_9ACTN|nr:hypothetical protein [Embleya scabrispora]OPC79681.1 hypothetical protein B4N89_00825 [Embleya scabrispora]
MRIGLVLRELQHDEQKLAYELLRASERHRVDHEIHHLGRDLARWSQRHVRDIADIGDRFGVDLDPRPTGEPALSKLVREKAGGLVGRHTDASLLMLRDLRGIHVQASGVSVDWVMIAQAAQALRDTELLDLAQRCHPDTLRQLRWANAKLEESCTQILVT